MPPKSEHPYSQDFLEQRRRDLERARSWLQADLRSLGASQEHLGSDATPPAAKRAYALSAAELSVSPSASACALLREVDDALARLQAGLYGWDPAAGTWIRAHRLAAVPTARHEIEDLIQLGRPER